MNIPFPISVYDIFDVALVSVLLYGVYLLFSKSRAARVLSGLTMVGILYLIALQFDLRLTVTILQAFFAVIIIAMIIIFQDEIRRLFERIGNRNWFGKKGNWKSGKISTNERRIQILVDTATDLAEQKVGALMVIEGIDKIDSLLSGGIPLNGKISESIIKSIFDPHSQGHDGAIIISNDLISRFACHLPLSTESAKITEFGTRHAAGLGITEHCDALSIIISEERGAVAIAKDGDITVLDNPTKLLDTLRDFYKSVQSETRIGWTRSLFTKNLLPKFISIGLSIILWILIVLQPSSN